MSGTFFNFLLWGFLMKRLLMAIMAVAIAVTFNAPAFASEDKKEEKKGGHVLYSDDKKEEKKGGHATYSDDKKEEKKGGHADTFGDEKKDEHKGGH